MFSILDRMDEKGNIVRHMEDVVRGIVLQDSQVRDLGIFREFGKI